MRLSAAFTEVGTLELWCESQVSEHRWRLQFQLRALEQEPAPVAAAPPAGDDASGDAAAQTTATAPRAPRS